MVSLTVSAAQLGREATTPMRLEPPRTPLYMGRRRVEASLVRRTQLLVLLVLSILVTSCASSAPEVAGPPTQDPQGSAAEAGGPQATDPNAPGQTAAPPTEWTAYSPKDGSFAAQFPGKPEETIAPADGPKGKVDMHQFSVERQTGSAYMASYTDFPVPPPTSDQIRQQLAAIRDAAVKTAQATLVDDKEITVNGLQGREFTATMSIPEAVTTHTRVFMKGSRLYQFMALVPKGLPEDGDVRHFLDSIALTP